MMPRFVDVAIDRFIVPIVAFTVVLPALVVWHVATQRDRARRGWR
ncbi:MAG TPA: hypothetical protein VGH28_14020 [Polyangiaceae bacterium]